MRPTSADPEDGGYLNLAPGRTFDTYQAVKGAPRNTNSPILTSRSEANGGSKTTRGNSSFSSAANLLNFRRSQRPPCILGNEVRGGLGGLSELSPSRAGQGPPSVPARHYVVCVQRTN